MREIRLAQGESLTVNFPAPPGIDFTGYHAALAVRSIYTTYPGGITLTLASGLTVDSLRQMISAAFVPSLTQNLLPGLYQYDCFTKAPDGTQERLEHGYFVLDMANTHSIS